MIEQPPTAAGALKPIFRIAVAELQRTVFESSHGGGRPSAIYAAENIARSAVQTPPASLRWRAAASAVAPAENLR